MPAPSRVSEMTTMTTNMTISSGRKITLKRPMPFCTPSDITTISTPHTRIMPISTWGTKSKLGATVSATCRYWPIRKPSGSSPQAFVKEKIV